MTRPVGRCRAYLADVNPVRGRKIAVPPNRVSDIVNGKRSITADTALRLGKVFGASPERWLNLQVDYDLRVARRTSWPRAEPRVRVHAAQARFAT